MSERQIDLAKHAIGLDYKKPYKRHRKLFYRPYRNYFTTCEGCNDYKPWIGLVEWGYAWMQKGITEGSYMFGLTKEGRKTLGQVLGMTIYDVR